MVDCHSSEDYLEPRIEKAIDCGITSDEELEKYAIILNVNTMSLTLYGRIIQKNVEQGTISST